MTYSEEAKPDLLELAHYGVKGMKWGVRRDKPSSSRITDARARTASRRREIQRQVDKVNLASSTGKRHVSEAKKLADMQVKFLKNPDRATALRLTTGEKVALGILAVGVPGAGTGAAAGYAGGRLGARKIVERQQRRM